MNAYEMSLSLEARALDGIEGMSQTDKICDMSRYTGICDRSQLWDPVSLKQNWDSMKIAYEESQADKICDISTVVERVGIVEELGIISENNYFPIIQPAVSLTVDITDLLADVVKQLIEEEFLFLEQKIREGMEKD